MLSEILPRYTRVRYEGTEDDADAEIVALREAAERASATARADGDSAAETAPPPAVEAAAPPASDVEAEALTDRQQRQQRAMKKVEALAESMQNALSKELLAYFRNAEIQFQTE